MVYTKMPAVLIEYLFHTNHADVVLLKTSAYRDKLAVATAKGICKYFGVAYDGEVSAPSTPVAPPITTPTVALPTLARTLSLTTPMMSGDDIRALQTALNAAGYSCGTADGYFGSQTQAAVRAFQSAKGLAVDGIVGQQTWAALGGAASTTKTPTSREYIQISVNPKRMSVYINTARKTITQIKAETGADYAFNGALYHMPTFKPVMTLKVDGKLLSEEPYDYTGFGWNGSDTPVMTQDYKKYQNFITGTLLIEDFAPVKLIYPAEVSGKRGRTAIGMTATGKMEIYCCKDGSQFATTVEALQSFMVGLGCKSAIMLDSGGSAQMLTDTDAVMADRIVQNLICVWEADAVQAPAPSPPVVDAPAPHWAVQHRDYLQSIGVTISDARYDDPITRGELFALLEKYDKLKQPDLK